VKRLRGIVPPLVTPLVGRDQLDVAGLERLLEHVLQGGVSGIFLLGTTGEAPSLSHRLRHELVQRACRIVDGRVPVLVGVTDTAFVESIALARRAADSGAHAVVLSAPYYFRADQPELAEYLEHIVPQLALPVFLYNIPSHTKVPFALETVRRALALPRVVGMKDSSGDLAYFRKLSRLVKKKPGFTLLIGSETHIPQGKRAGAHGAVPSAANLVPRLFVDLYDAPSRDAQALVLRLQRSVFAVGRHPSSYLKGLKCALSLLGICDDFMAEPFARFRAPERERVRRHLERLGISAAAAARTLRPAARPRRGRPS
jgi:dihydrodipicolinate synthase/N-acetylneuraminate lyase